MKQSIRTDPDRLRRFVEEHPLVSRLAAESSPERPIHLVGGAVRDALTGRELVDLDLVVERDAAELGLQLAPDALVHERFGTAELEVEGHRVDIATARRESYSEPGALPDVTFPARIEDDMARRDFTINAMAITLHEPESLIDPYRGRADLEAGVLRVLHDRSFIDDPTRALRAARYAARFGFEPDPATAGLLGETDLGTVSRERVEHEITLMAAESSGIGALRLAAAWGLLALPDERLDLAEEAAALLDTDTWRGRASRAEAVLQAIGGYTREVPVDDPETAYAGLLLARVLRPAELLLNRARGAAWLDRYEDEWSQISLAIGGDDLVLAGIPQGPAIGAGLAAALEAKLNRGIEGIESELAVAVEAAEAALRGE
jgi:tRNA nucleotidyltransferase (CCA-adding enzyme)